MRRKRMPQGMWTYTFIQIYLNRQNFDYCKYHSSGKLTSSPIQEQSVFVSLLYVQMRSNIILIDMNIFFGLISNGDKTLFIAFSGNFDKTFLKK